MTNAETNTAAYSITHTSGSTRYYMTLFVADNGAWALDGSEALQADLGYHQYNEFLTDMWRGIH